MVTDMVEKTFSLSVSPEVFKEFSAMISGEVLFRNDGKHVSVSCKDNVFEFTFYYLGEVTDADCN